MSGCSEKKQNCFQLTSFAKSLVFPQNRASFTLLLRVVLLSAGYSNLQSWKFIQLAYIIQLLFSRFTNFLTHICFKTFDNQRYPSALQQKTFHEIWKQTSNRNMLKEETKTKREKNVWKRLALFSPDRSGGRWKVNRAFWRGVGGGRDNKPGVTQSTEQTRAKLTEAGGVRVWRVVFGGLVGNLCFRSFSFECVCVKRIQTIFFFFFSVRNAVFNPPTQRNSTKAYQIKSHIQQKLELTQTDQSGSLQRPTVNKDERERGSGGD